MGLGHHRTRHSILFQIVFLKADLMNCVVYNRRTGQSDQISRGMLARITMLTLGIWLAVGSAFFPATQFASGQDANNRPPTEDLLPETTVLLLKITSMSELYEKIKDSSGGKLLQSESIAPLAQSLYEQAEKQYAKVEENVGLSLEEIKSLPSGEVTVAMIAPRRKEMAYVMLMELDEENEAVKKAFDRGREYLTDNAELATEDNEFDVEMERANIAGRSIYIARGSGYVIASSSKPVLEDMLTRWSGGKVKKVRPLSQNRKFVTIQKRCSSSFETPPDLTLYVDPIGIFKGSARGNIGMQAAVAALPLLGLDGLLAIGGNAYILVDEYESITHGHLLLSPTREGIVDALTIKQGDYQPQPWVPANIATYVTTHLDVPQMFARIRQMVNSFNDDVFDERVERVNDFLEVNLEEDVVENLSGRVTIIRPILPGDEINSTGFAIAFDVKDSEAAQTIFEKISAKLSDAEGGRDEFEKATYQAVDYYRVSERRRKRREERFERIRKRFQESGRRDPFSGRRDASPCYALLGESLLISDSELFLKAAIENFNGEGKGELLRENEAFQNHMEQMTQLLTTDVPAGVLYSDSFREIGTYLKILNSDFVKGSLDRAAESSDAWQGVKDALDDNPLPSAEELKQFFPVSGGAITAEDSGYHFLLFQALPELDE